MGKVQQKIEYSTFWIKEIIMVCHIKVEPHKCQVLSEYYYGFLYGKSCMGIRWHDLILH